MLVYLLMSVATTWIFLRLEAWLSLLCGLLLKSQIRAVLTMATITCTWLALPTIVRQSWSALRADQLPVALDWLLTMHPVEIVRELERGLRIVQIPKEATPGAELPPLWGLLVLSLLLHLGTVFLVRRYCLRNADRLLGRLEPQTSPVLETDGASYVSPASAIA